MKICCIFNYAPFYRESIYRKIDETFDAQFCFSDFQCDIPKMDYTKFKREPHTFHESLLLGKLLYRSGLLKYAIKPFDTYLMIGDTSISHIPFLILCRLLGKKIYAWGHGAKSFGGKMGFVTWLHYKLWNGFFCYGDGGKKRLVQLGVPESKLYVIYNSLSNGAVPLKSLESPVLKEHFGNNYPTILFVGRLTPVKKLDWILEALAKHQSCGVNYNVLIVGDGAERSHLEEMVNEYGLYDRVWLYGECYNKSELNRLIYNSTLCVSPGNVGLTAIHALEFGTPVLSHNDFETQMPEYESIVPGETGALYEKDNYIDFCDCIKKWIESNPDRNKIRQNCYDIINSKFNSMYQIKLLKSVLK